MSKHDSSTKRTEDRSDQLLSSEAFEPEHMGLGKEVKISLAAITILVGVLGYVLYGHFFGPAGESGDGSAVAAGAEDGALPTEVGGNYPPPVSPVPEQFTASRATITSEAQWPTSMPHEPASSARSDTEETSSGFTFMPSASSGTTSTPAPIHATPADRLGGYAGGTAAETSDGARLSGTAAAVSGLNGQTHDPFQGRAAEDTGSYRPQPQADSYPSHTDGSDTQLSTDNERHQTFDPSAGGQAYTNQRYDPRLSADVDRSDTAVVEPDGDTMVSPALEQNVQSQAQAYPERDASSYASGGSSVRIESAPRYPTDRQDYTTANTHGHTGGTDLAKAESDLSSRHYNDYGSPSELSIPPPSADFSPDTAAAEASQSGFSDTVVAAGRYSIQPNDNYWSISEKLYGTGHYYQALEQHNLAAFPNSNHLGVGKEIETPDLSQLERLYPDLCPKPERREAIQLRKTAMAGAADRLQGATVYVVQEGDTLFDIARYELGKATRWAEIYQLNRDRMGKDFDYLTPGMKLIMPSATDTSDQAVGTMTQRSGARRRY